MPSAPTTTSQHDVDLAADLARGAGEVLLALRAAGAPDLKAAGDQAAQAYLAAALRAARPADVVLSEEAKDDPSRLAADRVWIIDPLDGTREFSEHRDDFAVHVALWERGQGLTAGAVALPDRGRVFTSRPTSDTPRRTVPAGAPLRVAASRTRPPAFVAELAERGEIELVPMGSAGVKVMAVVDGTVDVYVHGGGQYEWDSAAPVAVATAHGLVCTRLDGSALEYNRANPWLPDLLVSPLHLQTRLRGLLDTVTLPEG